MAANKPILMVVDSEIESLERMIDRFRVRQPLADLIGVDSGEKALEIAAHHPISAVLVDECLKDMSGTDLIAMVRKLLPEVTTMVLTELGDPPRHHAQDGAANAHYFSKSSDLDGLINKVGSYLFKEQAGFRGILENLEIPDILQLLCFRKESTHLRISSEYVSGFVIIDQGEVVHAQTTAQVGEEAFYELFALRGGKFQLQQFSPVEKRTITTSWQRLLLQAGQRMDEADEALLGAGASPQVQAQSAPAQPAFEINREVGRPSVDAEAEPDVVPPKSSATPRPAPQASASASRATPAAPPRSRPATSSTKAATSSPKRSPAASRPPKPPEDFVPIPSRKLPEKEPEPEKLKLKKVKKQYPRLKRARRKRRTRRVGVAAEVVVILVMAVPIVWLLYLALPWLLETTRAESHLKSVFARVMVRSEPAPDTQGADVDTPPAQPVAEWGDSTGICTLRIAPLKEFAESGNIVAISSDMFDLLELEKSPWVELIAPNKTRMGALAIKKRAEKATLYVRRTMAAALGIAENEPSYIKINPVRFSADLAPGKELHFTATRLLAEPYCEYLYPVGIGLSVMEEAKLAPGSYAIAKGPKGYQSVQIQVMDRGNPDEIWMSGDVRDALGITKRTDRVTLYPKDHLSAEQQPSQDPPARGKTEAETASEVAFAEGDTLVSSFK